MIEITPDYEKFAQIAERLKNGEAVTDDQICYLNTVGLFEFNRRGLVKMGQDMHSQYIGAGHNHCAETVAFREKGKVLQVRLILRAAAADAYPGHYAAPGTFEGQGEDWDKVFERLVTNDFRRPIKSRTWIAQKAYNDPRGWITSNVYLVDIEDDGNDEGWYSVEEVLAGDGPRPIIPYHRDEFIPIALMERKIQLASSAERDLLIARKHDLLQLLEFKLH